MLSIILRRRVPVQDLRLWCAVRRPAYMPLPVQASLTCGNVPMTQKGISYHPLPNSCAIDECTAHDLQPDICASCCRHVTANGCDKDACVHLVFRHCVVSASRAALWPGCVLSSLWHCVTGTTRHELLLDIFMINTWLKHDTSTMSHMIGTSLSDECHLEVLVDRPSTCLQACRRRVTCTLSGSSCSRSVSREMRQLFDVHSTFESSFNFRSLRNPPAQHCALL